jgi:hypothetical protein
LVLFETSAKFGYISRPYVRGSVFDAALTRAWSGARGRKFAVISGSAYRIALHFRLAVVARSFLSARNGHELFSALRRPASSIAVERGIGAAPLRACRRRSIRTGQIRYRRFREGWRRKLRGRKSSSVMRYFLQRVSLRDSALSRVLRPHSGLLPRGVLSCSARVSRDQSERIFMPCLWAQMRGDSRWLI